MKTKTKMKGLLLGIGTISSTIGIVLSTNVPQTQVSVENKIMHDFSDDGVTMDNSMIQFRQNTVYGPLEEDPISQRELNQATMIVNGIKKFKEDGLLDVTKILKQEPGWSDSIRKKIAAHAGIVLQSYDTLEWRLSLVTVNWDHYLRVEIQNPTAIIGGTSKDVESWMPWNRYPHIKSHVDFLLKDPAPDREGKIVRDVVKSVYDTGIKEGSLHPTIILEDAINEGLIDGSWHPEASKSSLAVYSTNYIANKKFEIHAGKKLQEALPFLKLNGADVIFNFKVVKHEDKSQTIEFANSEITGIANDRKNAILKGFNESMKGFKSITIDTGYSGWNDLFE